MFNEEQPVQVTVPFRKKKRRDQRTDRRIRLFTAYRYLIIRKEQPHQTF